VSARLLNRRHAEEPLVLPAELRRALVTDRSRDGAWVMAVVGHEPLGPIEPDSLEELEAMRAEWSSQLARAGSDTPLHKLFVLSIHDRRATNRARDGPTNMTTSKRAVCNPMINGKSTLVEVAMMIAESTPPGLVAR
jgi:hypothetical protein